MREKNTATRRRNAKRAQNAVAMLLLIASLLSMGGFAFAAELEPQPPAQEETISPAASGLTADPEQPGTDPETPEETTDPEKKPETPEETTDPEQDPETPEETTDPEKKPEETADPVPSPADPESSPADPNAGIMPLALGDPEDEPALLGLDDIAVRYFVAENGEWKEITPAYSVADGSMSFAGTNRYYVTATTLQSVYGAYGFSAADITSADDRIFPHTKVEDKNRMHADAAPAQNTEGVWCIPLGNGSSEFHLYYVPTNKSANTTVYFTGPKNVSDAQLKKDNSFYTVEVNTSELGSEEAGLVSVSVSPVFTGSAVTVTLPKLDGDAHWRLTDGERSMNLPKNKTENAENNTVTYTINNIASRHVFSVSRGITIEYDAALGEQKKVGSNIAEDGKINGKSTYSIDIADGQAHTVLRIDKDTVTVNMITYSATRKIYYTFKGWRLNDTDTIYTYNETEVPTISYETLQAAADETGTVKLKAVWSPYIQNSNNVNFIATAGFYIRKGVEVHATDYDYEITKISEFTETTFNSRVVGTPLNPTNDDYDLIQEPTTPTEANKVDEDIRNALVKPFAGIEFLDKMPTDEEVFAYLRESNKVNDILNLQGQNLPKEKLTPERFTVRWYVVKYDPSDGFHVDGVIVAKPATLVVKKTFAGDSAAIEKVKENFNITIEHDVTDYIPEGNKPTGEHKVDFKLELAQIEGHPKDEATGATRVGYDSYDSATDTYTWIVTGLQGVDYQVIENNYQLDDTNIEQESTYRVTNSRVQNPGDIADTGWQPYTTTIKDDGHRTGAKVRMYAYADDFPMASRQTITLHNTYTKPGVITVFKSDMTSEDKPGGGIPDVTFTLGDANGQALTLYRNGTTPYYATTKADENYVPVSSAVTDEHGHFFVALSPGTYTLAETAPTGYNGAKKVKFTVSTDNTINADSITAEETPQGYGETAIWASVNTDNTKQLDVINRPLKFDITVKNTWRDEDGEADAANTTPVQLDLYQNNVKIQTVTLPLADGETPWQYTWDDMPMFVNGALAEYSVTVAKIGDTYHSSDLLGAQDGYANFNVTKDAFKYWLTNAANVIKNEPYWKNENAATAEEREKIIFAEHLLIGVNIQPVNGALSFKKHADTLSGPGLAGAKYTLYNDANLTSVHKADVTSDASGMVNFGALAAGDYFLYETEAPKGFIKDETVYKVSVLAGEAKMTKYKTEPGELGTLYQGEEAKTYVNDMVNKTALEITVNNKSIYGDALTGGEIELYETDENGQNAQAMQNSPLVMTENGVKVTLGQGTYRLVQTEVAEGYVKYETAYDFKVDNGRVYGIAILRTLRLMRSRDIVHVEGYDITGSAADGFTVTLYNKPVETPESPSGSPSTTPDSTPSTDPDPDSSTSPKPSPTTTPTPGATVRPVPGWWYNPYTYGGLPQTGQVNWPVPVLIILGAALCVAGAALMKKRGKK